MTNNEICVILAKFDRPFEEKVTAAIDTGCVYRDANVSRYTWNGVNYEFNGDISLIDIWNKRHTAPYKAAIEKHVQKCMPFNPYLTSYDALAKILRELKFEHPRLYHQYLAKQIANQWFEISPRAIAENIAEVLDADFSSIS